MATEATSKEETTPAVAVPTVAVKAEEQAAPSPLAPLSRTEAVVHCAAIFAALVIAVVSLFKGQNDLAKWSLGAIAVIAGVKLADFAGMRRGRSLGSIIGPGATMAFAAVALLSTLQTGCPGNTTQNCTTPNVYSCVLDFPRYCSSDRRLTTIGDVPCAQLGQVCTVLGGGAAALCLDRPDATVSVDAVAADATTAAPDASD